MRIAQVVTYVSADGAFGGPVAVAIAQSQELAARGHEVHFFAGRDADQSAFDIDGVAVHLFPTRRLLPGGFSGLVSPGLTRHLATELQQFDVVHVHLGRDLITSRAARQALKSGVPIVLQTHGMVMPDARPKSRIFDALYTRTLLKSARAVLSLTTVETAGVTAVSRGTATIERIANGIRWDKPDAALPRQATREVVFLARLHPRKRVMVFAEAARDLLRDGVDATFHVIGPDEGDLAELRAFITEEDLGGTLRYEGTLAPGEAVSRLHKALVYVLPSFGEVFPMTVLEAISAGAAVVVTQDCGISEQLAAADAALVIDGSAESLRAALEELLASEERVIHLTSNATAMLKRDFSIEAVVDTLEAIYR